MKVKKVALVPFYKFLEKNRIFKINSINDLNEQCIELKEYFKKNGYILETYDLSSFNNYEKYMFFRIEKNIIIKLFLKNKLKSSVYLHYEPPTVIPYHDKKELQKISNMFGKILTWNDELVDGKKFFKYYYPAPHQIKISLDEVKNKRKLICNISGNKKSNFINELYSERRKAIKFFEEKINLEFGLYGRGWNKVEFPSYKGEIDNKYEVLKKYKFSLCFENTKNLEGYITEKIYDCFYTRTIPIYLGSQNISDYIPNECYIDFRKYSNYEELYLELINMSEEEYKKRVQAIDKYLKSENFNLLSSENFCRTLYQTLIEKESINFSYLKALIEMIRFFFLEKIKRKIKRKVMKEGK